MKFEFSAGGVVFQKSNTKNHTSILVCQHSQHHGWVFPKGLINDHTSIGPGQTKETKEQAALREVEEETGVKGRILQTLAPVEYWYIFEGQKIKKTVYYFLMEYVSGDITKHDFEMENVEWLSINKVKERLTYPSDREVWREASQLLTEVK